MNARRRLVSVSIAAILVIAASEPLAAQDRNANVSASTDPLEHLIAEARENNPRVAFALREAEAAAERIGPAGAWEDPVLTLGVQNLPPGSFSFTDPGECCTQVIAQIGQRLPLPGKLGNRTRISERLAESRRHVAARTRVEVTADVKRAYAELYYLDRALDVTARNRLLLTGIEDISRSRYATGVGRQPAVLRAGLELDGLDRQKVALNERRRAMLARLNAAVGRASTAPVDTTPYPEALLGALGGEPDGPAFAPALGGDAVEVPGLPPLDSLVARAASHSPEVLAHIARIDADAAAVDLARAEVWPDPTIALQYGSRVDASDRLSAVVSFSIPIFAGRKQRPRVREAQATLAADRAMHDAMLDDITRRVVEAYARLADAHGQLAILSRGVLQRSEANLDATLSAYRAGTEDFLALLDSQSEVYRYELERHRSLADFLSAWADLESVVGEEIEP